MEAGQGDGGLEEIEGVPPQLVTTPGMPTRQAVGRRQARVREVLHTLPPAAQAVILEDLERTSGESAASYAGTPDYGD